MRFIPAWEVSRENKEGVRRFVMEAMARLLEERTAVRIAPNPSDLFAEDLGLKDWLTPNMAPCSLVAPWVVGRVVPDKTAIGIYKVAVLSRSCPIERLEFRHGTETVAINPLVLNAIAGVLNRVAMADTTTLQKLLAVYPLIELAMEGYLSEPIIYGPNAVIDISVSYHRERSLPIELLLVGFKMEVTQEMIDHERAFEKAQVVRKPEVEAGRAPAKKKLVWWKEFWK